MGFFDEQRKLLGERGIDGTRLPPGQYLTDRFPVLHYGATPRFADLDTYTIAVVGAVERPLTLSLDEVRARPAVEITTDLHCVTKWSKFDTRWKGCPIADLLVEAGAADDATHLMFHCEQGYTTNLPIADVNAPRVALLAYEYDGAPLDPDHGYPLRTLVPHLYLWKSAKWVRAIEVMTADRPGFWEQNGYHMYGDPFLEQRHWGD